MVEALDLGARFGELLLAFLAVQRTFEQGAEDGGIHLAPVGGGGVEQAVDVLGRQRQHVEQGAQCRDEELVVGALEAAGALSLLDEGGYGLGCGHRRMMFGGGGIPDRVGM